MKKNNFKKIIFLRTVRIPFLRWLNQKISNKFLDSVSQEYLSLRSAPTAVFANDYLSNKICINGFFEKELLDNLTKFMKLLNVNFKDLTFVDIGANIGNHSIYFSSIVKYVHAFEVNPLVFNLLKLNAELRRNITPYNVALGADHSSSKLFIDKSNLGASFIQSKLPIKSNNEDYMKPINVEIKPFDEYLELCGKIGIIKLDVEGMEYEVLQGAKKTIKKYAPIILFEQQLDSFVNKNSGKTRATSLLKKYSYKLYLFRYPHTKRGLIKSKINLLKELILNSRNWDVYVEEVNQLSYGVYHLVVALPPHYQKIINKLN